MLIFSKPENINGEILASELGISNDDLYVAGSELIVNAPKSKEKEYNLIIEKHNG